MVVQSGGPPQLQSMCESLPTILFPQLTWVTSMRGENLWRGPRGLISANSPAAFWGHHLLKERCKETVRASPGGIPTVKGLLSGTLQAPGRSLRTQLTQEQYGQSRDCCMGCYGPWRGEVASPILCPAPLPQPTAPQHCPMEQWLDPVSSELCDIAEPAPPQV